MDNNKILLKILATSLAVFFIIALYFFQDLNKSSEIAAFLITLSVKIKLFLISLVFSGIITLISEVLLNKRKSVVYYVFPFTLILFSIWYIHICRNFTEEKHTTEQEREEALLDIEEENKKETEKLLKKAEFYTPAGRILTEDTSRIKNGIKQLLTSHNDSTNDKCRLALINNLLDLRYSASDSAILTSKSSTLNCTWITYSPDFNHLLSLFTYRSSELINSKKTYEGILLFVKKEKDDYLCYSYTYPMSQGTYLSREGIYYEAIARHLKVFGNYTLKYDPGKKYSGFPHPTQKSFWTAPFFFDTIKIENQSFLRFQTELGYDYERKIQKYIPRMALVINRTDSI